jgi:hypothetical protein
MWHALAGTRGLWAKVSGSQTDLLTPWYDGPAEIVPFWYLPVLLGGKRMSHVGWGTGDLPSQGGNAHNLLRVMLLKRGPGIIFVAS